MNTTAEAARNVALKNQYPDIDDPVKAIAFALEIGEMECHEFLSVWSDGDWQEIESYESFAPFLQRVSS